MPRGSLRDVRERVLRETEQALVELAHASMDLAVTVRAEHHTLRKLGEDLLPRTRDAILTDTEVLSAGVDVMKVEDHGRTLAAASLARTAHRSHGTSLDPAPIGDNGARFEGLVLESVPEAVAGCAEKIALRDLIEESSARAVETADRKFFFVWVAVMEVKRRDASCVSAVMAATAASGDELQLDRASPLLL